MKKFLMLASVCTLFGGSILASNAIAGNHKDHSYDDKAKAEKMYDKDIVDTAIANDSFSTLVSAIQAAGLVDALKAEGPFTVFAPTNDAFSALPEGTLESLLQEENIEQLQSILTFHVVPGKVKAKDIASGTTEVTTLQGASLTVVKTDSGVTVNGANVTSTDIKTSNGIIHVIDAVALPQ